MCIKVIASQLGAIFETQCIRYRGFVHFTNDRIAAFSNVKRQRNRVREYLSNIPGLQLTDLIV